MQNLSQDFIRNGNPNLIDRIRTWWNLDVYHATNLSEITDHFSKSPPKNWSETWLNYSAMVIMYNLEISMDMDYFKEEDLPLLDKVQKLPVFRLNDCVTSRFAYWGAGGSEDLVRGMQTYGFDHNPAKIPRTYLQYVHGDDKGMLVIKYLGNFDEPEPEEAPEVILDDLQLAWGFS